MSSLGQLSAGIAHELNNPLAGILGYAQMAKQKLSKDVISKEDKGKLSHYLEIIEKEAQRTKSITEGLLEFSRKAPEEKKPLDIREVIENTVNMMEYHINNAAVKVYQDYSQDLPLVLGNANQLQQVFVNLVGNAIDAMDKYKKEIHIKASKFVDERFRPPQEFLEIIVEDTGRGIPPEAVNKIFEPFYTTKLGKGTGLGLAISYAIIRGHKGVITVESKEGQGTRFRIVIPAYREVRRDGRE